MSSFCGFIVAISLFLALPISIIVLIIQLLRKKRIKKALIAICGSLISTLLFTVIGVCTWEDLGEYSIEEETSESSVVQETITDAVEEYEQNSLNETPTPSQIELSEKKESIDTTISDSETANTTAEVTNIVDLSEEEYKDMCEELWYDDIFFSEDNLDGKYVKLDLFVEENRFFTSDALLYNTTVSDFINEYDLKRNFFYCGVKRKDENSYVGGQISLLFSNNYDLDPSDYSAGDSLTIYGQVIDFSHDYWDGYNDCGVLVRYIDNN